MAVSRVCCALCGAPIEDAMTWPLWMRQFKAVYATNLEPTSAHLSGVGLRHPFADLVHIQDNPPDGTEPVEIYLMRSSFGGPNLGVGGPGSDLWGFPFHIPCWNILASVQPWGPPNTQGMLDFLRSFPIQQGILNFGHDYGGLLQYEKHPGKVAAGEEAWLVHESDLIYQRHDPFDVPDLRAFFEQSNADCVGKNSPEFHAHGAVTAEDPFLKLPNGIRQYILEYLLSKEVVLLKQSSRVFANLPLADSFWRSRFLPGREFDFVIEAFQHTLLLRGRWKSLYLFVKSLGSSPAMVNRKRVWRLASSMRDVLNRTSDINCDGDPVRSVFEPNAPSDNKRWTTATRALKAPKSNFISGRRSLRERAITLPTEPAMLFVSGIEEFGRFYVSGIRLETEPGVQVSLGYNCSTRDILLYEEKAMITGFCLAQDERGVRGITALSTTGLLSRWVGDHHNIPKRRLVLSSTKQKEIKYLKGGFDAIKLVSLSISDGTTSQLSLDDTLALRDSVTWFPDIPDQRLSFTGVATPETTALDVQPPLSMAIPGGQLDCKHLPNIRQVTVRIGDNGNIWGLDVYFTNETYASRLGVQGVVSEENLIFELDPGNERITSAIAFYMNNGSFLGFKLHTNLGRAAEFPPLITQGLHSSAWNTRLLGLDEGKVIGFCSRVSRHRGLADIGLIYISA